MRRILKAFCLGCALALGVQSGWSAEASAPSEWPQWRGPTRDGVAPAGPKLLDAWPKEGPPLLWKSDYIPSVRDGGCGSVVVGGGRVLVYVNARPPITGKTYRPITLEVLTDWGWVADLPAELAEKIEAARVSKQWSNSPVDPKSPKMETYLKEFYAGLDPKWTEAAKKYEACIKNRFKWGTGFLSWKELSGMSTLRDKEYKTMQELWGDATKLVDMHHRYGGVNEAFDAAFEKVSRFTDSAICLDAATGKEAWRKDFPDPVRQKLSIENNFRLAGASSTPAIAGDKCVVVGCSGTYCLSLKDGSVVWSKPSGPTNTSPLIIGNVLYLGSSAMELDTGKPLWQSKAPCGDASPVPWTVGNKLYLLYFSGYSCIDASNGNVVWELANVRANASTPVLVNGDTMVRFGEKFEAYKISPKGAELIFSKPLWSERICSPLVYQNTIFQNCDFCYDLKTGDKKWETKEMLAQFSSPILADGKIIAHAKSHSKTVLFKPTPEKFEQTGEIVDGVACCTSPALAGGRLYLRLSNCVACYDLTAK